jgi:hypothetical protein
MHGGKCLRQEHVGSCVHPPGSIEIFDGDIFKPTRRRPCMIRDQHIQRPKLADRVVHQTTRRVRVRQVALKMSQPRSDAPEILEDRFDPPGIRAPRLDGVVSRP